MGGVGFALDEPLLGGVVLHAQEHPFDLFKIITELLVHLLFYHHVALYSEQLLVVPRCLGVHRSQIRLFLSQSS